MAPDLTIMITRQVARLLTDSILTITIMMISLMTTMTDNYDHHQASCKSPDRLSILTYLSEFYHKFKAEKSPSHSPSPGDDNDKDNQSDYDEKDHFCDYDEKDHYHDDDDKDDGDSTMGSRWRSPRLIVSIQLILTMMEKMMTTKIQTIFSIDDDDKDNECSTLPQI